MKICGKCNKEVADDISFCPYCGENLNYQSGQNNEAGNNQNYQNHGYQSNNPNDVTNQFDRRDIEDNKVMGVLSYIGILVLVPILAAPKSHFSRFHANQGLILFIAEIIWGILTGVVNTLMLSISWTLGFVGAIMALINIAFFVLSIMGIVYAATGRAVKLPIISNYKILK